MAKQIAKFLFDSERALITINMSEYTERHTVARLIGAPAGYIGYEDSGQLEQVRRKPFCVLLLDEFEKAHKARPGICDSLLSRDHADSCISGCIEHTATNFR